MRHSNVTLLYSTETGNLDAMRGSMLYRVNSLLGQPLVGAIEFIIDPNLYADKRI